MRDKVLRFIRENDLIAPGSTLVCAVSGGKDSVCLLHLLYSLQEALSIEVEAAHLNHHLRGEESERDEAFVRALCKTLGVRLTVSHADVLSRCEETGESVEEAARVLRYRFFESLGKPVATAHTLDDNLETVLLNLVRGTGLRGLCGIPPKRGAIVRPMLCISREEVEAYLQAHALSHVEDSSNASDLPLRNRLRHEVLPLLRQENPSLAQGVFRMDEILRREDAFLDERAQALLRAASLPPARWSCRVLQSAPDVIQARAMRKLLTELAVPKPSQAHVDALLHLISGTDGTQSVSLPGNIVLRRSYDQLSLAPPGSQGTFTPKTLLPGSSVCLPELSLRVSCRFTKNYQKTSPLPCTFALKCDTIGKEAALLVRPRKTGDVIHLSVGSKSVKKLLIDRKIPAHERGLVPVLADSCGVILVYPFAADKSREAQPGEAAILIHFAHEKEYIQKEDTP